MESANRRAHQGGVTPAQCQPHPQEIRPYEVMNHNCPFIIIARKCMSMDETVFGQFRNLPNKKIEKGQKSSKKQTLRNKMTHLQNAFVVFFYFWSYLIAICTSSPRFLEVLYSGSGFAHDSSLFHVFFFREIICMNTSTMSCVGLIYKHTYIHIYISAIIFISQYHIHVHV